MLTSEYLSQQNFWPKTWMIPCGQCLLKRSIETMACSYWIWSLGLVIDALYWIDNRIEWLTEFASSAQLITSRFFESLCDRWWIPCNRFHYKPHGLKASLDSYQYHTGFFQTWRKYPYFNSFILQASFARTTGKLPSHFKFTGTCLNEGKIHQPEMQCYLRPGWCSKLWSVWGNCVHYNGNSMAFITHLLPAIWIFTAQQAWWLSAY